MNYYRELIEKHLDEINDRNPPLDSMIYLINFANWLDEHSSLELQDDELLKEVRKYNKWLSNYGRRSIDEAIDEFSTKLKSVENEIILKNRWLEEKLEHLKESPCDYEDAKHSPECSCNARTTCIPRPGESCPNEAEYYVWFEGCGGFYTFMCKNHLSDAIVYGVHNYEISQITRIEHES